jgi:shikimate kinase
MLKRAISLIGPAASGKSTVGPLLARELGYRLFDTDAIVSDLIGKKVDEIFLERGTEFFQRISIKALRNIFDTADKSPSIIIVGSSLIQNKRCRKLLKQHNAFVIALVAEHQVLIERIKRSLGDKRHASHPLLIFEREGLSIAPLLFEFREPFTYFADFTVDTSNKTINEVCTEIRNLIRKAVIAGA